MLRFLSVCAPVTDHCSFDARGDRFTVPEEKTKHKVTSWIGFRVGNDWVK